MSPIIKETQGSEIIFRSNITLNDSTAILLGDNDWADISRAINDNEILVHGVVIEDSVYVANTNSYVRNVMREMIPNQGGTIFNTNQTGYWFSWTDNLVTTSSALNTVIFVQNVITKEVYMVRSGSTQFVPTRNIPNQVDNNLTLFPNPASHYFEARFDAPIDDPKGRCDYHGRYGPQRKSRNGR